MHAVTLEQLEEISGTSAARIVQVSGVDVSSVALDMTNFATFIDTGNQKAPVAQRGKAKQKRSDLRLVGLGLVVTRDGGIPLTWHAYPGDRPDVTQFPDMVTQLTARYGQVCAAAGLPAEAGDMTWCSMPGRTPRRTSPTWLPPDCTTSGPCPPRTART
jgi:transposase